jgi:amidohydrolase
MKDFAKAIYAQAIENRAYTVDLRRRFHKYPELSAKEFATAEKIELELDKLGAAHKRVGETGVYAQIEGLKKGSATVLLRADIDALPICEKHECAYKSLNEGVMHACGHDAHAASLLGAAKILAANREKFGGTARLVFQQGEEIGYGAGVFIGQGLADNVDRVFGIHMASNIDVGSIAVVSGATNASVDWFKISVSGKSAHVSTPELGADAAYIASQIVISAQALATRLTNPVDRVLVGIGKLSAGTSYNIVAGDAQIEGTLRTFAPDVRKRLQSRLESLASSVAETFGGSASVEWKDYAPPLVNDKRAAEEVCSVAAAVVGVENVITEREPSFGGDDFARFLLKAPGAYAFVGSRNEKIPETCVAHHNEYFDIDENALVIASALYAGYAIGFCIANP